MGDCSVDCLLCLPLSVGPRGAGKGKWDLSAVPWGFCLWVRFISEVLMAKTLFPLCLPNGCHVSVQHGQVCFFTLDVLCSKTCLLSSPSLKGTPLRN